MPVSRRYELLGWAMRSDDRYIIEDDYDSEFRLAGRPLAPLQNIDAEGRVIYMNTFTKTLASTVRVSYMVLPQALCERFYRLLSFYSCTVSTFEQYTLALFINEGTFEQHLNRMRILYAQKRARLVELLHQSRLVGRFEMYGEQLGLHFLLKIDTKYTDPELSALFLEKGLRISMLSEYFRAREQAPMHVLVLNYSSVKLEDLKQAVDILEEVLA